MSFAIQHCPHILLLVHFKPTVNSGVQLNETTTYLAVS